MSVLNQLQAVIRHPSLVNARALELALNAAGFAKHVFGRVNQKSSIEAASESDRGVTERLANAFDASLTAARLLMGVESNRALTPRVAAKQFYCPQFESCEWSPQDVRIAVGKPTIRFWGELEGERNRFRKFNPAGGLATVLVADSALGIARDQMPKTILDLNSASKLRAFEAIGQFGHGGSSSLAFCESCLIVTQPRFDTIDAEVYWTLIVTELDESDSKQSLKRVWFADKGLPLVSTTVDVPELQKLLPGTAIWHFGYNRGDWINRIAGPEQRNPWGRLGRLFFSYPLPFEIEGEFARTDTNTGRRTIKGAYFRLADREGKGVIYRSGERVEQLRVDGQPYGNFSLFVFVLADRQSVRDYVDPQHPIILSLNGQNHGEMTSKALLSADLPELASSCIVEIRLDGLEDEALNEIISNSRELPKRTQFYRALEDRVIELLASDEMLKQMELDRQLLRARRSSEDLNRKMEEFLSSILSDALALPAGEEGDGPEAEPPPPRPPTPRRPEVPAADPPQILQFLEMDVAFVTDGHSYVAKFCSDARPPKYSFHGDNPRCFARLELSGDRADRLTIVGRADIDERGYGSVTLLCQADAASPILERVEVGLLKVTIQSASGETLEGSLRLGLKPRPEPRPRRRTQSVKPEIVFGGDPSDDLTALAEMLAEERIVPLSECTYLQRYSDALSIDPKMSAYWGEKNDREGTSIIAVEINASHPSLKQVLRKCKTAMERAEAKERLVRDIVFDCYQHTFELSDVPELVVEHAVTEPDGARRAAEICLNFDKALRLVSQEIESKR